MCFHLPEKNFIDFISSKFAQNNFLRIENQKDFQSQKNIFSYRNYDKIITILANQIDQYELTSYYDKWLRQELTQ